MTISVNVIFGSKSSVCRNDAYSVVRTQNGETELIDIIPAEDIDGTGEDYLRKGPDYLLGIFEAAADISDDAGEIKQIARQALKL